MSNAAERPKVLFLSGHAHRALDPLAVAASGGAELQVALLAEALAERGYRAVLAAAADGVADGTRWKGVLVRTAGRFDTGHAADTALALGPVLRVLADERPDVVVVYGWTAWLAVLVALRPVFRFRLGFVCALDSEIDGGFLRANPVRGRLFLQGMRAADFRLAITTHQAELFHRQGMACGVMRLLLQNPRFSGTVPTKSTDLLWVARCHPVKRPHEFLDLFERLPGVTARMICSRQDAGLFAEVRRRADAMAGMEFFDGVPYREIQDHFDAARIFVNTSSDEGVPNTFLHAAQGGAAIASLVADPDRMIQTFGAGLCAGGDIDALTTGICNLLDNPAALESAVRGGRRILEEWYDNAANLEAFVKGAGL